MRPLSYSVLGCVLLASRSADAAGGATNAAGTALDPTDITTPSAKQRKDDAPAPRDQRWIRRHAPQRNEFELGAYGGVLFPSADHELFEEDPTQPDQGYSTLDGAAGTVGGRFGYAPIRFLALELEGGAAPTHAADGSRATLWRFGGSAVAQLGLWSVVPFVLAGTDALGVSSSALGDDVDLAFHFGGGVKINATDRFQVRVDVRDVLAAQRGIADGVAHNPEVLVGAAVRLGRRKPEPASTPEPGDRDHDGWVDPRDACPDEPGVAPNGCPIPDTDGDKLLDPDDACPQEAGPAPTGCPVRDRDRDSFADPVDSCPDDPGVEPDGCPLRDTDGDKIFDPDDACVEEPETRNGFDDTDGCPDELPAKLSEFTGAIEGIAFDVDRDTIRSSSLPVLDRAVEVLSEFPSLRIEISGHTDSSGKYRHNLELSARRADAVKRYLVDHGIDASRIVTRGAGPDEPRSDNTSSRGRQANRRIEFQPITE